MDQSEKSEIENIDNLIEDLGGCGKYQVVIGFFILLFKIIGAFSIMLMTFGNYNPGWQCLDNTTVTETNRSASSSAHGTNETDECRLFHQCKHVQFEPGVSTIVTEWNLLCDRAWISSLIISVQMAGVFVGSLLAGYLGDKFGRKLTLYLTMVYHIIVNVVAMFSTSWQMFAAMRFLIGMAFPIIVFLPVILMLELVPPRWRNAVITLPHFPIGCVIFTLFAMATKNWRYIHGVTAISSFIVLLPGYWMPESLRWLIVKHKVKKASNILDKIARANNRKSHNIEVLQRFAYRYRNKTYSYDQSMLRLFKKDVRKVTIIIAVLFSSYSLIYYAISYGVKALPGDFFINLIIMFSCEPPMSLISSTLPNCVGRKLSIICFLLLTTAGLFSIAGVDLNEVGSFRRVWILVAAMVCRSTADSAWDISVTYIGEFYPTVIRSTSIAYGSVMARFGGVVAPYFIPNRPDEVFISYAVMGALALICCVLLLFLQETKGKALPDTFDIKIPASGSGDEDSGNRLKTSDEI